MPWHATKNLAVHSSRLLLLLLLLLVTDIVLPGASLFPPLLLSSGREQVDEEPVIRTNTTICLGNIAKFLTDVSRKRILNAFSRALKDPFGPARAAGLMAINATAEYYETKELASRIVPPIAIMSLETDPEVTEKRVPHLVLALPLIW